MTPGAGAEHAEAISVRRSTPIRPGRKVVRSTSRRLPQSTPQRTPSVLDQTQHSSRGQSRSNRPTAEAGPGRRGEVEQLLRAEERRLVAETGDLDRRGWIEIVAVVVAPDPEVDEAGRGDQGEKDGPCVEQAPG